MKELVILYVTSQGEDDATEMGDILKLTLILYNNLAVFDVNVFIHISF